jgi:hypothetical protein
MAVPVALVVERLGEVPGRGREAIVKVGWELLSLLLVAPRGGRVSVVSAAWFQSSQMLLVVYQCTAHSRVHIAGSDQPINKSTRVTAPANLRNGDQSTCFWLNSQANLPPLRKPQGVQELQSSGFRNCSCNVGR